MRSFRFARSSRPQPALFRDLFIAGAALVLPCVIAASPHVRVARPISLVEARPILAALGDRVPAALRDLDGPSGDVRWSRWLTQRDAEIRGRIAVGDEDSVVNLLLYGTRFTRLPRATPEAIAASASKGDIQQVMDARVADLAAAIESPGGDERLRFVRTVVERHGIVPAPSSREATRRYLIELRSRVLSEKERYTRRQAAVSGADAAEQRAVHATLYRDRGLSSDTSLRVDFAIEETLRALRDRGELRGQSVGRVAVVGPGLDFVDKAQGYDFFPVQTIQPFALADSLRRLGVAERPRVTALDISPRVIRHIREARLRAAQHEAYRVNVVLEREPSGPRMEPALVEYWRHFGDGVGAPAVTEIPAEYASRVRARAVDLRPEVVLDVREAPLNVVLERFPDIDSVGAFDLVAATNVLVYYDSFEQALAVANMASMLRAGGLLVTNQPVPVPAASGVSPVLIMSVAFDRVQTETGSHERGDSIFVYRKQ